MTPARDEQQRRWEAALQTYRAALGAYRRVLESKAMRELRTMHHSTGASLVVMREPAPAARPLALDGLTPREQEVAGLLARGFSNKQIAETLVLTRGTVANHVAHILDKVGATNRTQVAARWLQPGPPPPVHPVQLVPPAAVDAAFGRPRRIS